MAKIAKAYAITDAQITFVSLVDKAANKHKFLIKKANNGMMQYETVGRILKADDEHHYVTGVVYEPMVEDTQGNYMTEEEIAKAEHWYMKNGHSVDLQHSFDAEPDDSACVVESWITKSDEKIAGQLIKKGTWMMTIEVSNPDVWSKVQKGEITGFSMGGFGNYSKVNTELLDDDSDSEALTKADKKSLLNKIAKAFGLVDKGDVKDRYDDKAKGSNFWNAVYALEDALGDYDLYGNMRYTTDPDKIRDALTDFDAIITDLLAKDDAVLVKSVEGPKKVEKAGRKMSGENKKTLAGIIQSLNKFAETFDDEDVKPEVDEPKPEEEAEKKGDEKEEDEKAKENSEANKTADGDASVEKSEKKEATKVTKAEVEAIIKDVIEKSANPEQKSPEQTATATDEVTVEVVTKMVQDAIQKAEKPVEKETISKAEAQQMVDDAIAKVLKSKGVSSNLNNEEPEEVKKSQDECYLHGIL